MAPDSLLGRVLDSVRHLAGQEHPQGTLTQVLVVIVFMSVDAFGTLCGGAWQATSTQGYHKESSWFRVYAR
jgi:hypothetical protein